MVILRKKQIPFDRNDVKWLDSMMEKFVEWKGKSGMPDYSPTYVGYTPVLALALLRSEQRLESLTWVLVALTCILGLESFLMAFR